MIRGSDEVLLSIHPKNMIKLVNTEVIEKAYV